ncbi:hypothetical protein HK104_006551 [Borealophlyctis nickersoniae]|nr:hypothetical protein HK104_006551 [Borealophlyctis nickersoniae]
MNGVNGDAAAGENVDGQGTQQTEWERTYDSVMKNPEDFSSWETLIRLTETANGGVTKESAAADKTSLKNIYDSFLRKFPLCFGYWKKYVDWMEMLEGHESAEADQRDFQIFEQGVASIHNSLDLWCQYCHFKMDHWPNEDDAIRQLFERAAVSVGYDFLSHDFWDKYITWEESKGNAGHVMALLERIIRIPLHQYTRFFEKYSQVSVTRPIDELVSVEERKKLEDDIKQAEGEKEDAQPKTPEEKETILRTKIHELKSEIYMKTQEAVHARWVFESEIKRPYFHVKPLDEAQLANWRRYLDYEEEQGDVTRIYVLYERCLVACALYEEFWLRYARWTMVNNPQAVRSVFQRAHEIFIPLTRPAVRFAFATYEEGEGQIDVARQLYQRLLEAVPGHVEAVTKYVHFERRQGSGAGPDIFATQIAAAPDDASKAFLEVQRIKFNHQNGGDVAAAREAYKGAAQKYPESKYLWWNYMLFEIAKAEGDDLAPAQEAWNALKASPLSVEERRQIGSRYVDFLIERSPKIAEVNKVELEMASMKEPVSKDADSRKRSLEDPTAYQPGKQAKLDGASPAAGVPPAAAGAAAYYGAQGQAGAAPWAGAAYAGYGQQGYGGAGYAAGGQAASWDYSQQQAAAY